MPKSEARGLSGVIEVSFRWKESSSGHIENESSVQLVAEGKKNVVLKEMDIHRNSSKSNLSHNRETCYEIDIDRLLLLIREHGKPRGTSGHKPAGVSGSQP